MKVLHVIPNPFFVARGGIIRAHEELTASLEAGIRCEVCCYHFGEDVPGVPLRRIPWVPWYRRVEPGANFHRIYLDWMLMIRTLMTGLRMRPDIIHAHLHEGVFASLPLAGILRVPLLLDAEGSLTSEMATYGFPGIRFFRVLERFLNRKSDFILTSSEQLLRDMQSRFSIPPSRLSLFEDCVDTAAFSPHPPDPRIRSNLGIPEGVPIVVYLGSLENLQGIDIILESAKILLGRLPQAHFLIMGFPNEKTWEDRFRRDGIGNVRFTGKIPRADAPSYLSLGTVAISPKRSGSLEANGKLIDYMAVGLPVVATDNRMNRDILGTHGCFVLEGDAEGFAKEIITLAEKPEIAKAKGKALRERACQRFSKIGRGERLLGIYDQLLRNKTATPN